MFSCCCSVLLASMLFILNKRRKRKMHHHFSCRSCQTFISYVSGNKHTIYDRVDTDEDVEGGGRKTPTRSLSQFASVINRLNNVETQRYINARPQIWPEPCEKCVKTFSTEPSCVQVWCQSACSEWSTPLWFRSITEATSWFIDEDLNP